jgi:hypothetical protein
MIKVLSEGYYSLECDFYQTIWRHEQINLAVTIYARIQKMLDCNLGLDASYPDSLFS